MSGRFTRSWCEAGAQTPPLLRASSPLKPKNQLRTNIENWYCERGHFTTTTPMLRPICQLLKPARWRTAIENCANHQAWLAERILGELNIYSQQTMIHQKHCSDTLQDGFCLGAANNAG